MPLKLVPPADPSPAEQVRQRAKRAPKPAEMLQCRCGCRELIETRAGVLFQDGKAKGGTRQLLCAACWRNGNRVVVA